MLILSHGCSGVLRTHRTNITVDVTLNLLDAQEQKDLANQICKNLHCGRKHVMNKTVSSGVCLADCILKESKLHNCTTAAEDYCTNAIEVICGESSKILGQDSVFLPLFHCLWYDWLIPLFYRASSRPIGWRTGSLCWTGGVAAQWAVGHCMWWWFWQPEWSCSLCPTGLWQRDKIRLKFWSWERAHPHQQDEMQWHREELMGVQCEQHHSHRLLWT